MAFPTLTAISLHPASFPGICDKTGIAMAAVATAIDDANDGIQSCVEEWQRRDLLLCGLYLPMSRFIGYGALRNASGRH